MSIRQHENSIMMCTEITHKVLRTDTVLQLLEECYRESRSDAKKLFMNRILGCVVLTDYNNRTYSIDDVDWQVNPNGTFQKKDGSEISYVQYFREVSVLFFLRSVLKDYMCSSFLSFQQ